MGVVEKERDVGHVGRTQHRTDQVNHIVGEGDLSENERVGSTDQDKVEPEWGT